MLPTSPHRRFHGLLTAGAVAATVALTTGTAHAELAPDELRATTDHYLFDLTLEDFVGTRAELPHADQLDWSSDGCSSSPDAPLGYEFRHSCDRHDFGYRNYPKQERFTEENRHRIDDNFKADMYHACGEDGLCKGIANIYHFAVREFGGPDVDTAEAVQRARITSTVDTSGTHHVQVSDRDGQRITFELNR